MTLPLQALGFCTCACLCLSGCKARPSGGAETKVVQWTKHHITVGGKNDVNPIKDSAENIEAGKRIFGYYCGCSVVNLDGLVNDETYYREVIQQRRLRDYLRRERIELLADEVNGTGERERPMGPLERLEQQLELSVELEDYEEAARIRDQISRLDKTEWREIVLDARADRASRRAAFASG